jgi:DNA primase
MGNVLGFTGRTIDKDQQPKYLNTPETIIFHKGRILYNLTRARGDIKLEKNTVVVEGQMDVISSYQAGVKNVVATSGTALTPDHLQILYRYTPNITFAFDSDSAGLATAKKAFEMAIEQGFNVKMTELGKFKDPGEMIEKDAKLWVETVKKAKPVIEWYFTLAFGKQLPNSNSQFSNELTSQQKKEIAREILPIINKIPDTIEQADYLGKLAKKLDLGEEVIFDALNRQKDKKTNRQRDNQINRESDNKERNKISPEEILIGIIVKNPDLLKIAVSKIKTEDFEGFPEKVYKISKNWYTKKEEGVLIKTLKKELSSEKFAKLEILLLEIEEKYSDNLTDTFTDLVTKIAADKKEIIKEKYAKEISLAEKSGDRSKLKKLIQEFQDAIK